MLKFVHHKVQNTWLVVKYTPLHNIQPFPHPSIARLTKQVRGSHVRGQDVWSTDPSGSLGWTVVAKGFQRQTSQVGFAFENIFIVS